MKTRKFVTVLLAAILCLALFAGSVCAQKDAPKKTVIGVAIGSYTSAQLAMKEYFESYVGPQMNVDFIFSEEGGNVEAILSFVENAYSAGAYGIIDLATTSYTDVEPVAAKCDELGMYFVSWYGMSEDLQSGDYALGVVSVDVNRLADGFGTLVAAGLQDGEPHSMVLSTVAAKYGNDQMIQCSLGALRVFNETYGLGLSEEQMREYVLSSSTTPVETGRDDVKITIYPNFTGDELAEIIKTGEFDIVAVTGDIYARFLSAIKETEAATNKDIMLYVSTSIGESTMANFESPDAFGNPTINGALLQSNVQFPAMVAVVLNGIYGDKDAVLADGKPLLYGMDEWACMTADEYKQIDAMKIVLDADEIRSMIKYYNEDINPETLQALIDEYNQLEGRLSKNNQ